MEQSGRYPYKDYALKKAATSTTSHTYNLPERGGDVEKYRIVNYIEVDGEDIPMEKLSEEKRSKLSCLLADKMMISAGYKRKTA